MLAFATATQVPQLLFNYLSGMKKNGESLSRPEKLGGSRPGLV
jgi:hypothetical protein